MTSLDVGYRQVLVYFAGDAYPWHHRLLLESGGAGKWVCCTPDHDIQLVDLSELEAGEVVPVRRNAPFPAVDGQIYGFEPIARDVLARLVEEAREFALIMGFAVAPTQAAEGRWLVADPALESFACEVPPEALGDDDCLVCRGNVGLAEISGRWVHISWVADGAEDEWKAAKWAGAGRDPRLASAALDAAGSHGRSELAQVALWKPVAQKSDPAAPLLGPRLAPEWFEGLRASGRTLVGHDAEWRSRSGVPDSGLAARFHTGMTEVLRMMLMVDGIDGYHTVAGELVCRYLYMIESACDRNPRQPDWEGLEALVAFSVSSRGAIEAPKFSKWVSELQSARAQVLKQGRLLREERRTVQKDAKAKGKGSEES